MDFVKHQMNLNHRKSYLNCGYYPIPMKDNLKSFLINLTYSTDQIMVKSSFITKTISIDYLPKYARTSYHDVPINHDG